MTKTVVCVATYNERENLPDLVEEILQTVPDAHVLIVDDNSPDGTGEWIEQESKADPRLHCIRRKGKLGLGTAVITSMKYAIEGNYDYMVNMDADFSHPPRYLPDLLAGMEKDGGTDIMVASRYVSGGAIEGWPLIRRVMSKAVNTYARWMLWLPPKDCSGSFRCYRVSTLRKIDFDQVRSRGYSFFEEILWHLRRTGARFRETPFTFVDRERGESKIDTKEAISAILRISTLGMWNWLFLDLGG